MMFLRALALLLALGSTALAQSGQIPTGTAWGNVSASKAIASAVSLTSLFDRAFNTNQGSILNRGAAVWSSTRTPVLGLAGSAVGSIGFANATSGSETIQPDVGALGSGIATLPAGTYNLVGDTLSQGLTNKTVNKVTITAPATSATLTIPDGVTLTGPAASGTTMTLGNNETVTGVKTFGSAGAVGKLTVAGTTSGSTVLNATATASGTLTLPAATDTLVGKATADVLTNKTLDSAGTGNHIQISGVDVTRGQILGEASTTAATAGNIGEYIETIVAVGSAVSLVNATPKDIATITLTAGDWDISGNIGYITAATTSVTAAFASISATLNSLDAVGGRLSGYFFAATAPGASNNAFNVPVGPVRFSIAGSTTYHLVANANFTVAALTGYGIIRARRVR